MIPSSVIITVAALTVFLVVSTALKYGVEDRFRRTRLIMTFFFVFIVATLTISFSQYTYATLPYTIPSGIVGLLVGYVVGVRAAQQKLREQGLAYYKKHFAHVHMKDVSSLSWWSVINFYSVMSALILINLVGLSNVIFHQDENWAIFTCCVGAFLLGTTAPYIVHLWRISTAQKTTSPTSE
jgi:hypothetical protein